MAINPLQFSRPEEYRNPQVDFTPLSEIGTAIAGARKQRQLADAVTAATGPDGKIDANQIGVSLAKLGLPKEAMPFILAGQTAQFHNDSLGVQRAQLAESERAHRVGEGQSAASLAETARQHQATMGLQRDQFGLAQQKETREANAPMSVQPGTVLINKATGEKVYGNNESQLPPETIDQMARQAMAGDTSVFMNLGRGAQAGENIVAVRKRMAELNAAAGETGVQQANRNAEFFGAKASQRTLGTKQANIELAATEFEQVLPIIQKASQAVSRTNYPDLNRVIQAFEQKTGDPNVVAFGGGINTLVNLYARAISPQGVGTVSDKDHARELLSKAWSQGQFDAAVGMMKQEITAALNSPARVREDMRKRFMDGQGPASQPSAPANVPAPPPGYRLVK